MDIGPRKCEIVLGRILDQLNDTVITRIVMRYYNRFKNRLKALQVVDKKHINLMMDLLRDYFLEQLDGRKSELPEDVYTHARCCYISLYLDALEKAKEGYT